MAAQGIAVGLPVHLVGAFHGDLRVVDVDVAIGDQPTLVHELIGGSHTRGGWQMHAFDAADDPGLMRLTQEDPGLFLLHGDGVRSWFRPQPGEDHMTTLWEREVDGTWLRWTEMRFDRR